MRNLLLKIIVTLSFFAGLSFSQISLKYANVYGDYVLAGTKRLNVKTASGPGFGATVQVNLNSYLSFGINFGYNYLKIEQDSLSAFTEWNWRFYNERYKGIIQSNLASDSAISAIIKAEQSMDIFPLFLTMNGEIDLGRLNIKHFVGGGIIFYMRHLVLNETWKKYFRNYDYKFEYDYVNFAPNVNGSPFFLTTGIEIAYPISDGFMINTSARYSVMIGTPGNYGYDDFPAQDLLNLKLGIIILY